MGRYAATYTYVGFLNNHSKFYKIGLILWRIVVRGIVATPIRVDDQPGLWPTLSHGPDQCLRHQVTGDSLRHRPADHRTGVQVQDDGQIQPARTRPQAGDIGHPLRVGCIFFTLYQRGGPSPSLVPPAQHPLRSVDRDALAHCGSSCR